MITDIFENVYQTKKWGVNSRNEAHSGSGSEIKNCKKFLYDLKTIIDTLIIKSILDIGCGDFQNMKTVDMKNITYI
jgi:hypothetical protein